MCVYAGQNVLLISIIDSFRSPPATPSGEETLRKLLGQRSQVSSPTMDKGPDSMAAPSSPPKKSSALLDRYGGQAGPTGVARPGPSGASTSLASFMGGKASGPRLGKLAGDGRSAPPEADLIDESRRQERRALPGLASPPVSNTGGGKSLASFLEARAAASATTDSPSMPPQSPSLSKPLRSPSPGQSPLNRHEFSFAERGLPSAKRTESFSRPRSPVKAQPEQSAATQPRQVPTAQPRQAPTAQPEERIMTDAATSPLKEDQIADARSLSPSKDAIVGLAPSSRQPAAASSSSTTSQLAPASIVHSPTSDALSGSSPRFQLPVNRSAPATSSPAFANVHTAASDKAPTASLTRLRGQSLVGQRVREAKEREAASSAAGGEPASPQLGRSPSLQRRWTPPTPAAESPVAAERKPWQPGKLGNALPGLTGHPRSASPVRSAALATSPRQEEEPSSAPPVRLPGLGAASSPFASRQSSFVQDEVKQDDKLDHPTMARAKGPKRSAARSTASKSEEVDLKDQRSKGTFVGSKPPDDDDPTISRLVGSEQDTMHAIRPSDRLQASPRPTVREVEQNLRGEERQPQREPSYDTVDRQLKEGVGALEALVAGKRVEPPASVSPVRATRSPGMMVDIALPKDTAKVDISPVLRSTFARPAPSSAKTVSIDVLSVRPDGSVQSLADSDAHILYEAETLVITHRCKDIKTGLMCHDVFVRAGRHSPTLAGQASAEASKVQELAKRVNAAPIDARQGRESDHLVKLLGGVIVTREGARNRFEPSNTHMYAIRGRTGAIYIDQTDLTTSSLCSAHSFVISVMSDVFVWHGKGSSGSIRSAAKKFARELRDPSLTSALTEYDEGKEDELFWACFEQEQEYASSFHHELLYALPEHEVEPRLFSLLTDSEGDRAIVSMPAQEQSSFSSIDLRPDTVHVVQLPHEIYVVVGTQARSDRTGISAALDAASTLARSAKDARPRGALLPPVHALIFPSEVPRELRAAIRYWDATHLLSRSPASRGSRRPLGMNLMTEQEARASLKQTRFEARALWDHDFLPIGVGPDDILDD